MACRSIELTPDRKPIIADVLFEYRYTWGMAQDALLWCRLGDWRKATVELTDLMPSDEQVAQAKSRVRRHNAPTHKVVEINGKYVEVPHNPLHNL